MTRATRRIRENREREQVSADWVQRALGRLGRLNVDWAAIRAKDEIQAEEDRRIFDSVNACVDLYDVGCVSRSGLCSQFDIDVEAEMESLRKEQE